MLIWRCSTAFIRQGKDPLPYFSRYPQAGVRELIDYWCDFVD